MKSATLGEQLTEFHVKNVGVTNSFFNLSLPFSWIIKETIDELLVTAREQGMSRSVIAGV